MPPTDEQAAILDDWTAGRNVRVQAPPGTGKTWLILEAARAALSSDDAKVLVLAYNTELAADVSAKLVERGMDPAVSCHTFHGLCTHHIALAADDRSLERCIAGARAGSLPVSRLAATHVLVDEAQDLNALHVSLLSLVLDASSDVNRQYLVVGDAHQMLYDYGEWPATGEVLRDCARHFASLRPWRHHALTASRRVAHGMARLVDAHFGTGLRSVHAPGPDHSVHVHACGKWSIGPVVEAIVRDAGCDPHDVSILAATKTSNAPLTAALNHLSSKGVPIYVHGVDGAHADVRSGKVRVSSFHAAKGTECDTAVVLVPPSARDNPLYVALTRARRALHLVVVRDEADPRLCRTLAALGCDDEVASDDAPRYRGAGAKTAVAKAALMPDEALEAQSQAQRHLGASRGSTAHFRSVALDRTRSDRGVHKYVSVVPSPQEADADDVEEDAAAPTTDDAPLSDLAPAVVTDSGRAESVADVYLRAVLCKIEHERRGGRVRAMEDCIAPARVSADRQAAAISCGHQGRLVSPFVPDGSLLADDLRTLALDAYRRAASPSDWCTVAAAALSWNGYHHRMRQLVPADAWVDDAVFDAAYAAARSHLDRVVGTLSFDVRLTSEVSYDDGDADAAPAPKRRLALHARAHACSNADGAFHFVWSAPSAADHDDAGIRAILHPTGTCRLVSLSLGPHHGPVVVRAHDDAAYGLATGRAPRVSES